MVNVRSVFGLLLAVGCLPADASAAAGLAAAAQRPLVASHRGSTAAEPENTLPAMTWAKAIGADLVEIDLRVTADQQIVVIHDKRLDRTTNGSGLVRRHTLAELRSLDAGRGYRVPTVEEALDFAVTHCIRLLLDIKDARLDTVLLLQAIRSRGAEDLVIFGVRTPKQLATVNDAGPNLQTLLFTQSPTAVDRYLEGGVDAIRLWPIWIRSQPQLVRRIQEAGVEVWVSTGDLDGEELKSVIEMGVDGLITDRPQAALAYRAARSR